MFLPWKLPLFTCLVLILQPQPQTRSGVHSISTTLLVSSSTVFKCAFWLNFSFIILFSSSPCLALQVGRETASPSCLATYVWVVRIEDFLNLIRVTSKLYFWCACSAEDNRRPSDTILEQCMFESRDPWPAKATDLPARTVLVAAKFISLIREGTVYLFKHTQHFTFPCLTDTVWFWLLLPSSRSIDRALGGSQRVLTVWGVGRPSCS